LIASGDDGRKLLTNEEEGICGDELLTTGSNGGIGKEA